MGLIGGAIKLIILPIIFVIAMAVLGGILLKHRRNKAANDIEQPAQFIAPPPVSVAPPPPVYAPSPVQYNNSMGPARQARPSGDKWELHSIKERWGEIDGVLMFLYTHVVYLHNKTEFWTARVPGRYPSRQTLPVAAAAASCGTLQRVDRTHLFPPLDPGTHRCDEDEPEKVAGIFVKRVCVDAYDGSPTLARYVAHEARICQRLRNYPHPNLARFRGCDVAGGTGAGAGVGAGAGAAEEILGLCFDRYAETLAERMRRGAAVDTERCMEQIRAALRHLHGLQLVHNDVVPDNVMFVDDGPGLVLIDFDSCATRGGGLPKKRGPVTPGATSSEFENDDLGLQLIHRALLRYERATRSRT